jgi:LysM repeat protein
MKWKDSGEMVDGEENTKEENFDEEQYSPWAEHKEAKKKFKLGKTQTLFLLLVAAIVALVAALLVLLANGGSDSSTAQRVAAYEQRLQKLEERLDKYEGIDEKVTTIWEQAKSFEKFKDRFDRSEASTSLRMDHLTMSLEALQKQINEARPVKVAPAKEVPAAKAPAKVQYHQVEPGDTLYSISKKYNLKVEELLKMNQMKPDSVIVPGQKLIVGGGAQ